MANYQFFCEKLLSDLGLGNYATAHAVEDYSYSIAVRYDFGQPVRTTEAMSVIQAVAGVTAVLHQELYLGGAPAESGSLLLAGRAGRDISATGQDAAFRPAQLLLIAPEHIEVSEGRL